MRAAIAFLAVLVAGVFAAEAGAHHALLTEARYCGNIDTVFVTASAWEGIGEIGSAKWKKSRTNADVGIYLNPPSGPVDPSGSDMTDWSGAFNGANGFSFKAEIPGVTGAPVVVAARARVKWPGNIPRGEATEVTLQPETCSGPRDRFVWVNGKRLRCTVVGTGHADTLSGTPGRDVICGFRGRDRIWAGRGNDVAVGGAGADLLLGVAGRDFLLGGARPDELRGGGGRDRLSGGRGPDTFLARDGRRDKVSGGPQQDLARVDCSLDRRISIEGTFSPHC